MRFTLDGEAFELTADLVRSRLVGQVPGGIREYWVEIDDVRWPVKQVIAVATGARRIRFQSQDSLRWLQNLGFKVGAASWETGSLEASARPAAAPGSQRVDAGALEVLERVEMRIGFTWLRAGVVSLDVDGLPRFPVLPAVPGLYRFDFGTDEEGVRSLYIGESASLRQRASGYRNARTGPSSQRTNRRIHQKFVEHLGAGGSVEFAIAVAVSIGDGESIDLRLKSARRLAENAAVLLAQRSPGTTVLNIDADLTAELPAGEDEQ